MSEIKQTLKVLVPIADTILYGIDLACAKKLNIEFEKHGLPKGIPVEVTVTPRKFDYEAVATWEMPNAESRS